MQLSTSCQSPTSFALLASRSIYDSSSQDYQFSRIRPIASCSDSSGGAARPCAKLFFLALELPLFCWVAVASGFKTSPPSSWFYLLRCSYPMSVGDEASMHPETTKKLRKPRSWRHPQPITSAELKQMREEFWDTAPHYGGQKGAYLINSTFAFVIIY
ncbi:hypothetical protein ZIOFF_057216 [Zingiber officinale]|uniref:DC-UbP/UBTD2 N-terminal domain-containing protein n=1 Tax=Zingiber officinale TaxID=94328 RepID=A0A8J5KBM0_ZINOF|nr:hypothetical protein ZIOFF_057216 [Zingiber officinale]